MGATSEQFDLWVALRLKDQGLKAGMAQAGTAAKGTRQEVDGLGKSIVSTSGSMLKMVGALAGVSGLVGLVTKGAREFVKLEDGLAKVDTLLAEGQNAAIMYGDAMESMSVRFGADISVVTTGLYQAISASVDTGQALDFMTVAGKTAIGGLTDTATAVDGLTNVINAYGLGTERATHVADVFALAQKRGKTTIGEMAAVIGQVAPLAASMGVSFESVGAALATATKQGINIASATTSLRMVIASIVKPPEEAKKVLKDLGIEWGAQTLKTKGLAGSLRYLKEGLGGNTEMMSKVLGSVEALNIALALTSDRGMKDFVEIQDEMVTKSGEIEVAFGKMEATTGHKIRSMEQAFNRASRQIGVAFFDAIGLKSGDFEKTVVGMADQIGKAVGTLAKNIGLLVDVSERLFLIWGAAKLSKAAQAYLGSIGAAAAVSGVAAGAGGVVAAGAATGRAAVAGVASKALGLAAGGMIVYEVAKIVASVIEAGQINDLGARAKAKFGLTDVQAMAMSSGQGTISSANRLVSGELLARRAEIEARTRETTYDVDASMKLGNVVPTLAAEAAMEELRKFDASVWMVFSARRDKIAEQIAGNLVALGESGARGSEGYTNAADYLAAEASQQNFREAPKVEVSLKVDQAITLDKPLAPKGPGSVRARVDRGEGQARLVSPEYRMTLVREGAGGLVTQPLQDDVIDLTMLDARR